MIEIITSVVAVYAIVTIIMIFVVVFYVEYLSNHGLKEITIRGVKISECLGWWCIVFIAIFSLSMIWCQIILCIEA